jgi:hypothetical protein
MFLGFGMIHSKGEHGMGTTDLLIMLGLFVCLAVYGIWKHGKAEESDYKKFVDKATELSFRMTKLEKHCLEESSAVFLNALTRIEQLETKVTMNQVMVDEVQDHCARMRKSMIDLRDRSYPRQIEVTFPAVGAVPVEIRGPTINKTLVPTPDKTHDLGKPMKRKTPPQAKKLLKKTAKQIKGLSK